MPGRLEGKVAFITGAARGQGRSHAIRLAEEGADIIAIDICKQIESNLYPLSTPEDLAETAKAVENLDRRIIARQADVRDRNALQAVVDEGVAEFGHLDVVVANAGIMPMGVENPMDFVDATDVDLIGVMNTVAVSIPHLPDGAAIVVTGSNAGSDARHHRNGVHGRRWLRLLLVQADTRRLRGADGLDSRWRA